MKKMIKPPRLAKWLFNHMSDYQEPYSITGDVEEVFFQIYQEDGYLNAGLWYWHQCIISLLKYILLSIKWSSIMFKNYVKITLRNIKMNKVYSFINISGLAVGMACCLLILLFVRDELSYDQFHKKGDRIFRLVDSFETPGGMDRSFAFSSGPFAPTMKRDFPEVEDGVRFMGRRKMVEYSDKR